MNQIDAPWSLHICEHDVQGLNPVKALETTYFHGHHCSMHAACVTHQCAYFILFHVISVDPPFARGPGRGTMGFKAGSSGVTSLTTFRFLGDEDSSLGPLGLGLSGGRFDQVFLGGS